MSGLRRLAQGQSAVGTVLAYAVKLNSSIIVGELAWPVSLLHKWRQVEVDLILLFHGVLG